MQSNYFVVGIKSSIDQEHQVSGGTLYLDANQAVKELVSMEKALKGVGVEADLKVFHVKVVGQLNIQ